MLLGNVIVGGGGGQSHFHGGELPPCPPPPKNVYMHVALLHWAPGKFNPPLHVHPYKVKVITTQLSVKEGGEVYIVSYVFSK